jgi:MFS family permease
VVGIATGPLYDAGYFRPLIATGSFLVVFGMMMTSICTAYWQIMLAQAVCMGVGFGCLFVPSVAIVSTYFSTKKAFATGIAAAGSSLGGVVYPIVFHKLQPQIGAGWATRVLAFIMLATLAVSLSVMRTRILPVQKRALLDIPAFKEKPFIFFTLGMFFGFMGLYIPFFYVQSYAIEEKVGCPSPRVHGTDRG